MATLIKVTPQPIEPNTNYQVYTFEGELDKSNLNVVSEAVKDFFVNNIENAIFDLTNLKFINSEGIGYLVSLHYKISKANKKVYIFGVQPNVQDIFNLIGIPTIIPCFSTLDEVIAEISK